MEKPKIRYQLLQRLAAWWWLGWRRRRKMEL